MLVTFRPKVAQLIQSHILKLVLFLHAQVLLEIQIKLTRRRGLNVKIFGGMTYRLKLFLFKARVSQTFLQFDES